MEYDVFISYSRKDNVTLADGANPIQAFTDALLAVRSRYSTTELAVFQDRDRILVMDDWKLRLSSALKSAKILICFLSQNYFASEYCRWEWETFGKHSSAHLIGLEAIAPIYINTVTEFDASTARSDPWIGDLQRRQCLDFRQYISLPSPEFSRGQAGMLLEQLESQIAVRLDRAERALAAEGNVYRHNGHFSGREEQLKVIQRLLAGSETMTVVHGAGGAGKTALVSEYAHRFAGDYSGGRWVLRCEGRKTLHEALNQLIVLLGLELDEEERKDPELKSHLIVSALKRRTNLPQSDSVYRGIKSSPAALLILDNVDMPQLLSPSSMATLPAQAGWLHLLVTTRLGPELLYENEQDRAFLHLEEFEESEAVALIESHLSPARRSLAENEVKAMGEIACLLGRLPLAVEAAAAYIGLNPNITCRRYLSHLDRQGLRLNESIASDAEVGGQMRHKSKTVASVLEPIWEVLTEPERRILIYCCGLPPDQIPLPWVRTVASREFPELGGESGGLDDAWIRSGRRLVGYHLLRPVISEGEQTAKMHRLCREWILSEYPRRYPWWKRTLGLIPTPSSVEKRIALHASRICEQRSAGSSKPWELRPLARVALNVSRSPNAKQIAFMAEVATRLEDGGLVAEAVELNKILVDRCVEKWGSNEQGAVSARVQLAGSLLLAGLPSEAAFECVKALISVAVLEAQMNEFIRKHGNGALTSSILVPSMQRKLHYLNLSGRHTLGISYLHSENLREASQCFQQVIDSVSPETVEALTLPEGDCRFMASISESSLAFILRETAKFESAEKILRGLLLDQNVSSEHSRLRGSILHELGKTLMYAGKLQEARNVFQEATGVSEARPACLFREGYARACFLLGENAEAETVFSSTLPVREELLGPHHYTMAEPLCAYAEVLRALKRYDAAEAATTRAGKILEQTGRAEYSCFAEVLDCKAMIMSDLGRSTDATDYLKEALTILNRFSKKNGCKHRSHVRVSDHLNAVVGTD